MWNSISYPELIKLIGVPLLFPLEIWIYPFWPPCFIAFSKIIFLETLRIVLWLKFTPKMWTKLCLSIVCTYNSPPDLCSIRMLLTWFFFLSPKPKSIRPSLQENKNCLESHCPYKYFLSLVGFCGRYKLRCPMNMKLFYTEYLKYE